MAEKRVVYSVPYRLLDHRIAEHWQALRNGDVAASALAEHVFRAGHKMDLSKATVIDTRPHAQTHYRLESWHIQHEWTPLNICREILLSSR